MNTCKDCKYFIGGGDWNLCCSNPPLSQAGWAGFLCYSDTEACENFDEEELRDQLIQIEEKYKDAKLPHWNDLTEEEIAGAILRACEKDSDQRMIHLEPAAEETEETKRMIKELKEKINSKPFTMTEPIDITLKEDDDPFCLNLTTINPLHPGGN